MLRFYNSGHVFSVSLNGTTKDSIAGLGTSYSNGAVSYVQGPGNLQAAYFKNNFYLQSAPGAVAATCLVYTPSYSIVPSLTGVTVCTWALINSECLNNSTTYIQNIFLNTPYFTFQYLNNNSFFSLSVFMVTNGGGVATKYPSYFKYYISFSDIINKWHHMACTYIEPNLYFYFDGSYLGLTNSPGQTMTVQSGICMGSAGQGDVRFADATVADVRIYNYALSASDIYSIYSRAGGPGINPQGTLTQSPLGTIGPKCTMRNSGGI
jgi:Concanavalin A-like lectin/glucanases superfamily